MRHDDRVLADLVRKRLIPRWEHGYVNDPADPGGATKYGITAATLGEYLELDGPAQAHLVINLTEERATAIYIAKWFDHPTLNLREVRDVEVCYAIFDASVLFGRSRAAKWAQLAAGLRGRDVDGILGPESLAAINRKPRATMLFDLAESRIERHVQRVRERPDQIRFLGGWLNRALGVVRDGLDMG